ncbi:hypothetical protein JVU11DRAFT_4141 [Chiua virens]|nr:hypothetical protein JVU11DRAFT_4141 [Chiua virens]
MPTATTTTTSKTSMQAQGLLPLKASVESSLPSSSVEATLQSLYNRAAQAFLYRDVVLTTTLITSAFAMLHPPVAPAPDAFDSYRRKWDILRVTLESTVYASPPDRNTLPESLRELLLLSPQSFVTTSHARSLALFTPSSLPRTPSSAFLPHQVLITQVASSIKVNCPQIGREITEDWLSNRGQYDYIPSTGEAYEKVLELYFLHVLPRLEEWDYAKEFLAYEVELLPSKRTVSEPTHYFVPVVSVVQEFQEALEKVRKEKIAQVPVIVPSRLPSPAPSASSSNSSLSTISNRTVVPLNGLSKLSQQQRSLSSTSLVSDVTVTKSPRQNSRDARPTSRTSASRGLQGSVVATTGQSPGTMALIKESLRAYFTTNRLTTLAVLFLLLPVVSYIIRLRRARTALGPASAADQVKRRLFDARGGSVLHKLWSEVGRVIWDTVLIASSVDETLKDEPVEPSTVSINIFYRVKRGVAASHPRKYVLDENELERVSALARIELEDARKELERAHVAAQQMGKGAEGDEADDSGENPDDSHEDEWVDEDEDEDAMVVDEDGNVLNGGKTSVKSGAQKTDDLAEYHLDDYDDDVDAEGIGPFTNIKGLTFYRDNTGRSLHYPKREEDDERQDLEILPTDNLLISAKTEDEVSQLEVYVYDESQENLYASVSDQGDGTARKWGNHVAVGTLDPEIEIWSLDVVEGMYPDMVLGRPDKTAAHVPVPAGTGKKKRKKVKARPTSDAHHVDAVLGLSWNRTHRQMLASASADRTVKLWDLSRAPTPDADGSGESAVAIRSFNVHKDKVQAVHYDRTVRVFDSRAPDTGVGAVLGADVEALRWDPWESHAFYVSLENGLVLNFDARTLPTDLKAASPSRFTISAHDGAASALDVSPLLRGCVVTGGADKLVKVWNVDQSEGGKPSVSMVASRDLDVGKVFSAVFSPDDPLTIAAAGSKARLQIWDVGANVGARKAFAGKLSEAGKVLKEKGGAGLVGLVSDDESEGEGEGEEDGS